MRRDKVGRRCNRHILFALFSIIVFFCVCALNHSVWAADYFNCDNMDHFVTESACAARQKQQAAQSGNSQTNNAGYTKEQMEMWAEPSVDGNGNVTNKLPPLPAMRFMADPSPENAQQYLQWNQKRMEAIQRASQVLGAVTGASAVADGPSLNNLNEIKSVQFFFSPT